jgi:hypothetical protein
MAHMVLITPHSLSVIDDRLHIHCRPEAAPSRTVPELVIIIELICMFRKEFSNASANEMKIAV